MTFCFICISFHFNSFGFTSYLSFRFTWCLLIFYVSFHVLFHLVSFDSLGAFRYVLLQNSFRSDLFHFTLFHFVSFVSHVMVFDSFCVSIHFSSCVPLRVSIFFISRLFFVPPFIFIHPSAKKWPIGWSNHITIFDALLFIISLKLLCFASAPCQALSQSPLLSLIFSYCISACLYVFRFSMYFWSP
jgi:hypothetical protein